MNEDPNPDFMVPAEPPPHSFIKVPGTWVLSYNSYNCMQVYLLMMIAKCLQPIIKDVIDKKLSHGNLYKTPEQLARKFVYVPIYLKMLGVSPPHYPQLKTALEAMGHIEIRLPYKEGDITYYKPFTCLFKVAEFGVSKAKHPYVYLKINLDVWDLLMSFDKGYVLVDITALKMLRSVFSRKFYISMASWLSCGLAEMYPERLMMLLKGNADAFKHYSELENHVLMVAKNEIKALYDKGFIDEYFDYYPYYDKESPKGGPPKHITFKREYRQKDEEDSEHQSELAGLRSRLSIKLRYTYGIKEDVADNLVQRLRLGDVGELHNWLLHKDSYIKACKMGSKPLKVAGYMVSALNGFFRDHHC